MGGANVESVLASMTLGYVIGFGYLTGWDAYKLITKAKNPARNLFSWMVCGLIFACIAMSVGAWLVIHDYIHVSILSLFLTLLLWVVQVHFILQIIINRVSIISASPDTVNRVRFGVAIFITLINATVIGIFIPAVMGVSTAITNGGEVYVKVAKVIILMTDCFLNFYFISEVKDNLVRNGLTKYQKLVDFNMAIICVSVLMDLFLFSMTFLPGVILFVPFLPVTYITKLKIELSMAKLIIKIANEDSNTFLPPCTLQSHETSSTAIINSPLSTRIHFDSRDGETVRVLENVYNYGLGLGDSHPFVRSQDVPLCYETTQIEVEKRLPNNNYFPFDTLEAKAALPQRWAPTSNDPVDPPTGFHKPKKDAPQPESQVVVPHTATTTNPLRKIDLDSALQYGQAQGYPPLHQFLLQFTIENLHPDIPYKNGPDIILTCGNTDGFGKCLTALHNEWYEGRDPVSEREGLLCEEYAYMNAIGAARPLGMNIAPVAIDDEGMKAEGPGGLKDVLENWDFAKGKRPHLMYTVTIGQNPTSGVLSVQRRKEIYALCVKYDVIIIEDEPYWYLQYPSSNGTSFPSLPKPQMSSGYEFLDSLVPSYLSVDYQGRVLRLDTFSKTVAPGCRLGWITGQPAIIERIHRITETSTQQPSGFVQSMIAELIIGPPTGDKIGAGGDKDGKGWSFDGWVRWLEGLRGEYERRMNDMCDALETGSTLVKSGRGNSLTEMTDNLFLDAYNAAEGKNKETEDEWSVIETTRIYDFVRPMGGMFIWVRCNFPSHPLASKVALRRLARALWVYWTTYKVLVSPGTIFAPTEEIRNRDAWECFRLCFAACPREDVVPISERFAKGAQDFWRIKKVSVIDELLKDDDGMMDGTEVGGMDALTGFC